mgnify:CR=1 FL=1
MENLHTGEKLPLTRSAEKTAEGWRLTEVGIAAAEAGLTAVAAEETRAVAERFVAKPHPALRLQKQKRHFTGRVVPVLAVIICNLLHRLEVADHRRLPALLLLHDEEIILLPLGKNILR